MTLTQRWRKAVKHYLKLFSLTQWKTYIEVVPLEMGTAAQTDFFAGHHSIRIKLSSAFVQLREPQIIEVGGKAMTLLPLTLDELAAHEVLHVVTDPQPDESFHNEERVISDLAKVIARLSPSGGNFD